MKRILIMGIAAMALSACSHHAYVVKSDNDESKGSHHVVFGYPNDQGASKSPTIKKQLKVTGGEYVNVIPNATAFRMSGDYSNNVAVTFSPSGELIYFPAPTDITAYSEPIELVDGWWLNNQGLGPNSVFIKYTFAEYAALPEVPTPQQIKLSIIPGAKVTDFIELPMKIGETKNQIEEIKVYLKERE